jgi:protein-disulfide isomerase
MIENLSFRKNPKLFLPLYKEQNKVEDYIKDNTSKIIVGKPDSKIKLTLIVNLSCIYCIKINKIIYKLLKKYPQDLSIQFIFLTQKNDKKQIPYIKYLLYLYLNKGSEKFLKEYNNWFNKTKLRIQLKNHNNDLVYDTIIDNHRDWCVENEILTTPSILINRKRFPSFYHPNDIENFIGVVLDYEKNKSKL